MAKDLYDVLQVPQNATDAWLRRAADLRKSEIAADAGLPEDQKALALRAVEDALKTLSDPERRARYDARFSEPAAPEILPRLVSAVFSPLGIVCILLVMMAGGYALHTSKQERLRKEAEELRIAQEAELARQEIARREEETRQRLEAADARRAELREEQQRRQYERERRSIGTPSAPSHLDAHNEAARAAAARNAQMQAEAAQRREEAEAQARARAEEARRQRFLRERERKY